MISLVLAALFFFAIHALGAGAPAVRAALVAKLGEGPYMGLFSLASAAGLFWLGHAYSKADYVGLWAEPPGAGIVTLVLMLPLTVLMLAGLTMKSPTSVGQASALAAAEPAQGVLRITRHPFLSAVAGWAVLHTIVNGDLASLVMFGSLFALAVTGMGRIDRKRAAVAGADWERFAARTSRTPFLAIIQGRNELRLGEIGMARIAGGVVLWAALALLHPYVFNVTVLP